MQNTGRIRARRYKRCMSARGGQSGGRGGTQRLHLSATLKLRSAEAKTGEKKKKINASRGHASLRLGRSRVTAQQHQRGGAAVGRVHDESEGTAVWLQEKCVDFATSAGS